MMMATYVARVVIAVAPAILSGIDGRVTFLPRRYHGLIHHTHLPAINTRRCISSVPRGGSIDSNDVEEGIPEQSEVSKQFSSGSNVDISSQKRGDDAWDEEIRRARKFYSAPRLSSQTANKILINGVTDTETADGENEDDVRTKTTSEDERVFGNAQDVVSYTLEEDISEESKVEQPQKNDADFDVPTTSSSSETAMNDNIISSSDDEVGDSNNLDNEGGIETNDDSQVAETPPETIDSSTEDSSSQIYTLTEVESDIGESVDDERSSSLDEVVADKSMDELTAGVNDSGEDENPEESSHDNNVGEEQSSVDVDQGMDSTSSDVTAAPDCSQIEMPGENEVTEEEGNDSEIPVNSHQGAEESDEPTEVQSILEDTVETPFEDEEQELVPIPDASLGEEDLLVPGWQKATNAVASNKLVEEGLRRLQRRDGDEPSVPYVITRAMKKVLVDELGYDPMEVKEMRPDVAVVIVGEGLERPALDVLPSRFYNEIEPAVAIEESQVAKKSMRGTVISLIHRFRDEVSSLLAGRDPQSLAIVAASLGVALSLIFNPKHDGKKPLKEDGPMLDVPSIVKTPPPSLDSELSDIEDEQEDTYNEPPAPELRPDDLDKTWLDKLISLVSKPFGA